MVVVMVSYTFLSENQIILAIGPMSQNGEIIKWGLMITKHNVVTYQTLGWQLHFFKS